MSAANDFNNAARKMSDQVEDTAQQVGDDAKAEIAKLRGQLDALMRDKVTPVLADAAGQVQHYANRARHQVEDQADALAKTVHDRPLTALAVAGSAGFLLGWLMNGTGHSRDHR